jgi:methylated-DNA-protein-cysteine methyltransferase-like protein
MQKPPSPSAYYNQVYQIVRAIPPGRVMTYGSIAALVPPPAGLDSARYARVRARWVGYAMAACPEDVPWQRVINAQGRISLRTGHGPKIQRILLEQEGVVFNEQGKVDLKKYGWNPKEDWLLAHGLLPPQADPDPQEPEQPHLI